VHKVKNNLNVNTIFAARSNLQTNSSMSFWSAQTLFC